jgi:hypothetical protein
MYVHFTITIYIIHYNKKMYECEVTFGSKECTGTVNL